jgi:glycosyltransferase 2 family protein
MTLRVQPWRSALVPTLYLAALGAAVWAALAARGRLEDLSVAWTARLPPIVLLLTAQLAAMTIAWGLLLRAVDGAVRPSPWLVTRSFVLGWLIRYLPGVPASAAGRYVVCREAGYSTAAVTAALFYETLLQLGAGLLVPSAALAFWLGRTGLWLTPVAVAAVCTLTAVAASPPVVTRLARRLRRAGMASADGFRPPPLRRLAAPFLAMAAGSFLAALAFHQIAVAITPLDGGDVGRAVFAYGLAGFVGFVVPLLPSGLGVREGLLVALLGPAIGHGDALTLAVVARAVPILFDAGLAAALALSVGGGAVRSRLAGGRSHGREEARVL